MGFSRTPRASLCFSKFTVIVGIVVAFYFVASAAVNLTAKLANARSKESSEAESKYETFKPIELGELGVSREARGGQAVVVNTKCRNGASAPVVSAQSVLPSRPRASLAGGARNRNELRPRCVLAGRCATLRRTCCMTTFAPPPGSSSRRGKRRHGGTALAAMIVARGHLTFTFECTDLRRVACAPYATAETRGGRQ